MDDNIKKLIQAIRDAGTQVKDNTAYLDDREDRVMGYAIGEAFGTLAHIIEAKFTAAESDAEFEAHVEGQACGNTRCPKCNTYPYYGD